MRRKKGKNEFYRVYPDGISEIYRNLKRHIYIVELNFVVLAIYSDGLEVLVQLIKT